VVINRPEGGGSLRESVLTHLDEQTREQSAALKAVMAQEATDLIGNAQAAADRMISDARQEAFEMRREAYLEARSRATRELETEREQLRTDVHAALDTAVQDLQARLDATLEQMEPELIRLSLAVAEKIIGLELDRNDEAIRALVRQAMEHIRSDERMTVRISAAHSRRLEALISGGGDDSSAQMDLVPSPDLENGACILEGSFGMVDAGVSGQLDVLRLAWEVQP